MKSRKVYHGGGKEKRWGGPERDAGGHFLSSERRARIRLVVIILVVGLLVIAITALLSRQPDNELRIDYIDVEGQQAASAPMSETTVAPATTLPATTLPATTLPPTTLPPTTPPPTTQPTTTVAPVQVTSPADEPAAEFRPAGSSEPDGVVDAESDRTPGSSEPAGPGFDPSDPAQVADFLESAQAGPAPLVRPASPAAPLRIYVGGDSLSDAPRWGLDHVDANIEVIGDTHVSTGIVNDSYFDWPARVEETVAPEGYDVVVLTMGGNDAQRFVYENDVASPEWNAEYRKRVQEIFASLADGPLVVWIGMPPVTPDNIKPAIASTNAIAAELADLYDHVEYVDAFAIFGGPDGEFAEYLEDAEGELQHVRAGDGVHYTPTAGAWLAEHVLDIVASRMDQPGSLLAP